MAQGRALFGHVRQFGGHKWQTKFACGTPAKTNWRVAHPLAPYFRPLTSDRADKYHTRTSHRLDTKRVGAASFAGFAKGAKLQNEELSLTSLSTGSPAYHYCV